MKPIYLEPSEEITSVIEKIGAEGDGNIALVVPKNSSLFQSLVNLKLLSKEAKSLGKEVVIISGNKVGTRLAKQVGVPTYASLGAISAKPPTSSPETGSVAETASDEMIDGVPIRQYNPNRPAGAVDESPAEPITEETPQEVVSEETGEVSPKVEETTSNAVPVPLTPSTQVNNEEELSEISSTEVEVKPEKVTGDDGALPPIISRSGSVSSSREPFRIHWKPLVIALGLIILLMLSAFLLLPKATVTIVLPAEAVEATVSATVQENPSGDAVKGISVTNEQQGEKSVSATGKKDIGTKATGTITITNRYRNNGGVGRDQTFPAGTKVTDNNSKKVFTTNSSVTVTRVTYNPNNGQPIYDSESVKVTAVEPGESYNVGKTTFSVGGALSNTTAENSQAFSGGLTKQITVFSQADLDKAVKDLTVELEKKAKEELAKKSTGLLIVEGSIWQDIVSQTTSKDVGQEASTVVLKLTIKFGAIAFEQALVEQKLEDKLSEKLSPTQELIFDENNQPTITFKQYSADKKRLALEAKGKGYIVEKIDKESLASSITNLSTTSAEQKVKDDFEAEQVSISLTPGWWINRLPILSQAIKVEYGFNTESTLPETE